MSSESFPTAQLTLTHSALPEDKQISGSPTTGAHELFVTDKVTVGVWEHSVGVSRDVEAEEVFVVLSGKGRVFVEGGDVLELAPGVVGKLVPGAVTRWEIDEPIRKIYIFPK
jgi:uncharacterized cupin superfamily protein